MDFTLDPNVATYSYLKKALDIVNFLSLVGMLSMLLYNWPELTPCFRRQGVAIIVAMLYWQMRGSSFSSYLAEIIQVFMIFMLIQKINITETEVVKECLAPDTLLKKWIYIIYITIFSYYLSIFIIFCVLIIIFAITECQLRIVPTNNRRTSISDLEFQALEKVKFSSSSVPLLENQSMCSICLCDFEEQEEIIKLPICNHVFHKPCLRQWLETHLQCPYCRSDIKANLKHVRGQSISQNPQDSNGILGSSRSEQSRQPSYSLELSQQAGSEENSRNRYIGMVDI